MGLQTFSRSTAARCIAWLLTSIAFLAVGLFLGSRDSFRIRHVVDSAWAWVQPSGAAGEAAEHECHQHDGHEHGDHAKHDDHDDADHDLHDAKARADEAAREDPRKPGQGRASSERADQDHEGHDHADKPRYDHPHDDSAALKLSNQARANIGLRVAKVELQSFERTITIPGMIVERPGWSTIEVTAPMTGVVTRVYPIQGEAVVPGQKLFELRLTHEDLLQKQTEFLRNVEELDVVGREVARLEKIAADGAVAGKTFLERKYEQQKQQAALRAQRQALLLHGVTQDQLDQIEKTRTLLQSLTVTVPDHQKGPDATSGPSDSSGTPADPKPASGGKTLASLAADSPSAVGASSPLQVQELRVSQGTSVTAGSTLCVLVDLTELYIEGKAFEQDVQAINQAAAKKWAVSADLGAGAGQPAATLQGLKILYLDDRVETESRAFHFYLALTNRVIREDNPSGGRRFVYWQYKPGQRMQIRVPVETWTDRIVLPAEAVAQDGVEYYVFEANGDHFDRREVHVEYRDQNWVVIANDGAIRPGVMLAQSAAHQIHLALKNKAGAGVDPHAGHNH